MTETVGEGMCVQIGTVPSGPGTWSMSASRPFEGVVTSSGGYSYGPITDSNHQGPASNANFFLSGCNVCPGGALQVTFQFPGSPDSNSPSTFAAPGYPADCGSAGLGDFGDLDGMARAAQPVLAPIALVAAFATLIMTLAGPRGPSRAIGRTQAFATAPGGPIYQYGPAGQPFQVGSADSVPASPPPMAPPFIGSNGGQPIGGIGVHVGLRNVPPPPTSPDYARPPPGQEPTCWLHGVPCAVQPSPVGPGWFSQTAWWCPIAPPTGHYPWGPTYPQDWLGANPP